MLSGQIRQANESARIVDLGQLEVGYRLPDLATVFGEPLDHFGDRPFSVQPQDAVGVFKGNLAGGISCRDGNRPAGNGLCRCGP